MHRDGKSARFGPARATALLALILFIPPSVGCTIAGYAIGYGIDSANRQPERQPVRTAGLSPGHEVEIELRNGGTLSGEFHSHGQDRDAPYLLLDVSGEGWKVPRGSWTQLYLVTRTGDRPKTARRVGVAVGVLADIIAAPLIVISAATSQW